MNVILKIATGPEAGREVPIQPGEVVTVGRTSRSTFPLGQDTFLSGVHFALEGSESGCRLRDRGSANGTFLNGIRVTEAVLKDGDQISAGQKIFIPG
ncbi:MAG: FHA domain-containing protein, partial [Acidobacteriia bacterium]|nr:FHA domain-containing protein [Terriglobia bacterium]